MRLADRLKANVSTIAGTSMFGTAPKPEAPVTVDDEPKMVGGRDGNAEPNPKKRRSRSKMALTNNAVEKMEERREDIREDKFLNSHARRRRRERWRSENPNLPYPFDAEKRYG